MLTLEHAGISVHIPEPTPTHTCPHVLMHVPTEVPTWSLRSQPAHLAAALHGWLTGARSFQKWTPHCLTSSSLTFSPPHLFIASLLTSYLIFSLLTPHLFIPPHHLTSSPLTSSLLHFLILTASPPHFLTPHLSLPYLLTPLHLLTPHYLSFLPSPSYLPPTSWVPENCPPWHWQLSGPRAGQLVSDLKESCGSGPGG